MAEKQTSEKIVQIIQYCSLLTSGCGLLAASPGRGGGAGSAEEQRRAAIQDIQVTFRFQLKGLTPSLVLV